MRMSQLLVSLVILIASCEWKPVEIAIDSESTIKNIVMVVGDTTTFCLEGSEFSQIDGLDTSIAMVIESIGTDHEKELVIVGVAAGELKLYFNYQPIGGIEAEPSRASYLIQLLVTESIPLSVNVGEELVLNFSSHLSVEQLAALDSVTFIVGESNPGGQIDLIAQVGSISEIFILGEAPGLADLEILCYDSSANQITVLSFRVEISILKTVFAEMFTNSGCVNCPEANHYLDNISAEFANVFTVVRYHVNWTDPFDPMNLYNPAEAENRRAYYNIFAAPGFVLEGTLITSLDEDDWSGRVFNASQEVTPIYISPVNIVESVDSLFLDYDLKTFGENLTDLTIWSMVLEDSIDYAGTNGEVLHMDVMRDMTYTSASSLNSIMNIQHSLKKPDNYGSTGPMNILLFVQSEADKAMLQSRKQNLY